MSIECGNRGYAASLGFMVRLPIVQDRESVLILICGALCFKGSALTSRSNFAIALFTRAA